VPRENTPRRRDPIGEMLTLILERHESSPSRATSVPAKTDIARAWHDVLERVLQLRVGRRLSAGLSADQLQEFQHLIDSGAESASTAWLETHAPDHVQVVGDEIDRLVVEGADWFVNAFQIDAQSGGAR